MRCARPCASTTRQRCRRSTTWQTVMPWPFWGALPAPTAVTAAFAATTRAAVGIITELNHQIADLEAELATHFETHPDADIYLSLPGLGVILGARVLGEFGDDPDRYTTAKSRKNYAGTSPLTAPSC